MRTLQQLHDDFLATYKKIEPRQSKNPLAEIIVEARLNHFERNDLPDYQGRGIEFRRWFGNLLDDAGLTREDERKRFQSALRYATGNVLRRVLNEEQLEEAGLSRVSPKERGSNSYHRVAAPRKLLTSGLKTTNESQGLLEQLQELLDKTEDKNLRSKFKRGLKNLK